MESSPEDDVHSAMPPGRIRLPIQVGFLTARASVCDRRSPAYRRPSANIAAGVSLLEAPGRTWVGAPSSIAIAGTDVFRRDSFLERFDGEPALEPAFRP